MSTYRVLVVDDDAAVLGGMREIIQSLGHEVQGAGSAEEALSLLKREVFHLLVTDLMLPGDSGLDLMKIVRDASPGTSIVLVTGHASLKTAITALKSGASDYLTKPIDPRALKILVGKMLAQKPSYVASRLLESGRDSATDFDGMTARSRVMKGVFESLASAAATDTAVLISGESGTGKELCAASVHQRSARRDGPFMAFRAGALPRDQVAAELFGAVQPDGTVREGRVALAEGGTLFLDEVHTLGDACQAGLLKLLEQRRYTPVDAQEERAANVRIVAATSRSLETLVAAGEFRDDLFYRLNAFPLALPKLRERSEDVAPLASRFIATFAERYQKPVPTITEQTLALLSRYPWPGNVRELKNVMEHAVILCQTGEITPALLPRMLQGEGVDGKVVRIQVGTTMKDVEREMIARTLDANNWNKNRAARILGISRRSLYNKLERYQIVAPPRVDPPRVENVVHAE